MNKALVELCYYKQHPASQAVTEKWSFKRFTYCKKCTYMLIIMCDKSIFTRNSFSVDGGAFQPYKPTAIESGDLIFGKDLVYVPLTYCK